MFLCHTKFAKLYASEFHEIPGVPTGIKMKFLFTRSARILRARMIRARHHVILLRVHRIKSAQDSGGSWRRLRFILLGNSLEKLSRI